MKKVLFVIDSLNSGGAEKSLISLLTLFNYKEYEVDLLMFSHEGLYMPLIPKEVNIIDIPKYMKMRKYKLRFLLAHKHFTELFLRVITSLSLRNPLKVNNLHSAQIIWQCISNYIEKLNKPYDFAIAYSQGMPTYYVAEKVTASKKFCWVNTDYKLASYNKKYDENYYNNFNKIIAVSNINKDIFNGEFPIFEKKVDVIYDIVSPELIKSLAIKDGGFKDNFEGIRILTIGRLVDIKGYDLAIKACHQLREAGFKIKWYAIGEGNQKIKYENMVEEYGLKDSFIFLGTHYNPYTFLNQCDIYVQPSRFEGFGIALAEAKILKKHIVATNFSVVHDQIEDKKNGLIVKMESKEIYNGIRKIMEDQNLREKMKRSLIDEVGGTEDEINKLYTLMNSV